MAQTKWNGSNGNWSDAERTAEGQRLMISEKLKLAHKKQEAGDLVEAERLYKQVLAVDPGNQYALDHLGELLVDQTRFEEALGCFRKLLKVGESSWIRTSPMSFGVVDQPRGLAAEVFVDRMQRMPRLARRHALRALAVLAFEDGRQVFGAVTRAETDITR